jgi:4-hydroxythreonine-4-phosphate dehydrogenase
MRRSSTIGCKQITPRIVVTSGEPAGIGPDLCIAIAQRSWPCELIFVGDGALFAARARALHASIDIIETALDAPARAHSAGAFPLIHIPAARTPVAGTLDVANARYVLSLLDHAIEGCSNARYAAMVTAPVQKSVIADSGVPFSGHTEYLAERTGAPLPVMLLAAGTLRVALATTHLPLSAVSRAITPQLLEQTLHILDHDLRARFRIEAPRILVCGLNPHAGESGHLGREEIETIAPTLDKLRQAGLRLIGPAPADTAFTPRMLQQADAVLAMFHDQGLPVLKYAGFGNAVNVTLGLPIIRTSVDHGTALDLAASGQADAGSLIAAVDLAIELASTSGK